VGGDDRAAAWLSERAPAKINLTLSVTGRREDGYHEIESLVVFADLGERLSARAASRTRLDVTGPMGGEIGAGSNLVLAADAAFRRRRPGTPPLHYRLDKYIPVAAGLGGGSADAAACLRLLARFSGDAGACDEAGALAPGIGADVPVCLAARPALVTGIGESVRPLAGMPALALVLVNPRIAVATAEVFQALGLQPGRRGAGEAAPRLADERAGLVRAILAGGNDLEAAASALVPEIAEAVGEIGRGPGCLAARMSGSGATCFGLFADREAAARAAGALAAARPGWWVRAAIGEGGGGGPLSASG